MPELCELVRATWKYLIWPRLDSGLLGAVLLAFFLAWNLTKIPYYWPWGEVSPPMTDVNYDNVSCSVADPPRQCFGMECQANLGSWFPGYRAYKLLADPSLFLAPHCAMGVCLEGMLVLVLLRLCTLDALSKPFFLLSTLFAAHILPVDYGFPARKAGAPINDIIIVAIWGTAVVGAFALLSSRSADEGMRSGGQAWLRGAWVTMGILINTAPLGEWATIAMGFEIAREHNGVWVSPDGDRPLPESGRDLYARMECPAIGWVFTLGLLALAAYTLGEMLFCWVVQQLERQKTSVSDNVKVVHVDLGADGKFDLDGDGVVEAGELAAFYGRLRLCVRIGCLNKSGPALWQVLRLRCSQLPPSHTCSHLTHTLPRSWHASPFPVPAPSSRSATSRPPASASSSCCWSRGFSPTSSTRT